MNSMRQLAASVVISAMLITYIAPVVAYADEAVAPENTDTALTTPTAEDAPAVEDTSAPAEPVTDEVTEPSGSASPDISETASTETPADVTESAGAVSAPAQETPVSEAVIDEPTLTTDKADYAPGEAATIFGRFFSAMQNVVLAIVGQAADGSTAVTNTWNVSADESGSFTTTYQLPDFYVPLYLLAANSSTGDVIAQTSFTDSVKSTSIQIATTPNPSTVGQSVTLTGTVTNTDTGSDPSCGTVEFKEGLTVLGTATPATGIASISISTLTAGHHFITATYTPSATGCNYAANSSPSNTADQLVNNAIVKTDPTLSVSNSPVIYNGSAQAATVIGSVAGTVSNVKYDGSATIPTDAGIYVVTADFAPTDTTNYNSLTGASAGDFIIDNADANCSITGYSGTYDGNSHSASGSCVGVGTDGTLSGLDLGSSYTNVPGGNANWTFSHANYNDDNGSVPVVIGQAPSTVTINCSAAAPYTYTGSAQTPCTAKVSGVGMSDVDLTGDINYSDNIDAGTASADVNWDGDINHTGDSDSTTFEIGKADPVCTVTGYSGMYDGNAHGAAGSCVGVGSDGTLAGLALGSSYTNVPGGTAHWVFTDVSGNYNDESGDASIILTQAPSTVTVDCTAGAPFTYTGLAQTPCTAEATGAGMSPVDVTSSIVYGSNIHVGNATADASWAGDVNHTGNTGSGGFAIGQATLTVTASSASVLQGALLPAITPGYSGFKNGETVSVLDHAPTCSASVSDTNTAGDFATSCSGGSDNDYSFSYADGTLHVFSLASVFKGLFAPVSLSFKDFQKNSAIPVKFALNGGFGNFYGGEAALEIYDETNYISATAKGGSNTGNIFRYDSGAGQYIYNLDTKDPFFTKNHTYDFHITINGIEQTADQKAAIKIGK